MTKNTELFQDMNKLLNIRVDSYVRTSSSIHKETVYDVFRIIEQLSSSDIYSGVYKGWYDIANEKFVTNREAEANNFRNPSTGKEYVLIEEPAYFFKMEGYRSQIIKHIQENVDFIRPASRRNEILERLKGTANGSLYFKKQVSLGNSAPTRFFTSGLCLV